MSYNHLYTFGCSFTAGAEVQPEEAWPMVLASKMGIRTVHNWGRNGTCNEWITKDILELAGEMHSNSLVVIGWTEYRRRGFSYFGKLETLNPLDFYREPREGNELDGYKAWYAPKYYEIQDDPSDIVRYMNNVLLVQEYFRNTGIQCYMFSALNDIPWTNFLGKGLIDFLEFRITDFYKGESFWDMTQRMDGFIDESGRGNHPNKECHEQWADILAHAIGITPPS